LNGEPAVECSTLSGLANPLVQVVKLVTANKQPTTKKHRESVVPSEAVLKPKQVAMKDKREKALGQQQKRIKNSAATTSTTNSSDATTATTSSAASTSTTSSAATTAIDTPGGEQESDEEEEEREEEPGNDEGSEQTDEAVRQRLLDVREVTASPVVFSSRKRGRSEWTTSRSAENALLEAVDGHGNRRRKIQKVASGSKCCTAGSGRGKGGGGGCAGKGGGGGCG